MGDDNVHDLQGIGWIDETPGDQVSPGNVLLPELKHFPRPYRQPGRESDLPECLLAPLKLFGGMGDDSVHIGGTTHGAMQGHGEPPDDGIPDPVFTEGLTNPLQK